MSQIPFVKDIVKAVEDSGRLFTQTQAMDSQLGTIEPTGSEVDEFETSEEKRIYERDTENRVTEESVNNALDALNAIGKGQGPSFNPYPSSLLVKADSAGPSLSPEEEREKYEKACQNLVKKINLALKLTTLDQNQSEEAIKVAGWQMDYFCSGEHRRTAEELDQLSMLTFPALKLAIPSEYPLDIVTPPINPDPSIFISDVVMENQLFIHSIFRTDMGPLNLLAAKLGAYLMWKSLKESNINSDDECSEEGKIQEARGHALDPASLKNVRDKAKEEGLHTRRTYRASTNWSMDSEDRADSQAPFRRSTRFSSSKELDNWLNGAYPNWEFKMNKRSVRIPLSSHFTRKSLQSILIRKEVKDFSSEAQVDIFHLLVKESVSLQRLRDKLLKRLNPPSERKQKESV